MIQRLILSILLVLLSFPAWAQADKANPGETLLTLAATEHGTVAQDTLTATLGIEKQGADAKAVQQQINTVMMQALTQAKTATGVEVSTEQYYVYPIDSNPNDPVKIPRGWRGSQTLQLKSTHADALLTLAGALQDMGLTMQNLSYSVSPQKAEDARNALLESALADLRAKATRAAKALGKNFVDFAQVNVDSSGGPVFRPMAMMAMEKSAAMPAPVAQAGSDNIDLTVTAQAVLKP